MVTLVCCVGGPVFERYAADLLADARERWFPGNSQILTLPVRPGWPAAASMRRAVCLEHRDEIRGDYVFLIDADMRIDQQIGEEILCDGLTVTTHPGFPPGASMATAPFCRDPASNACINGLTPERYYPGCFHGGTRDAFFWLCRVTEAWTADDLARGVHAEWYDESYLNRYLIEYPPGLVLDDRYCFWDGRGDHDRSIIRHLNKTAAEFAETRA